jgi:hypothetical protein
VNSSGTRYGEFHTALRTGSFDLACEVARDLQRLTLGDALSLTLLAARTKPERFEEMARRWLARLLVERTPSLDQMAWASALLSVAPRDSAAEERVSHILRGLL